jgi:hypothetical protein
MVKGPDRRTGGGWRGSCMAGFAGIENALCYAAEYRSASVLPISSLAPWQGEIENL